VTRHFSSYDHLLSVFPHYERGARSPHPGYQAFTRAQAGIPVFAENTPMDSATTDLKEISAVFSREPNLNWFMRLRGMDGYALVKFGDAESRAMCEEAWGRLPSTQVVTRAGGTEFWIFQRKKGDPMFRLNRPILAGVDAKITSICPLPGNRHKRTGQTWHWREKSAPGEIAIPFLPKSWIASLPRRLGEETRLAITKRPEYRRPYSRMWTGDYN
jgi:hypothetical protein